MNEDAVATLETGVEDEVYSVLKEFNTKVSGCGSWIHLHYLNYRKRLFDLRI